MNAFAHREDTCGWRPRHPIVCMLNVIGFAVTAGLMLRYQLSSATAPLLFLVALQFVVSCIYHWVRLSRAVSQIDRSVIFIVIGATYVAYWGTFLPPEVAVFRLLLVGSVVIVGIAMITAGARGVLIGILWALFAGAGPILSASLLWDSLSFGEFIAFWISVVLYGAHLLVFARKYPDPYPALFGYTEVRHLLLPFATTINCMVVLQYS